MDIKCNFQIIEATKSKATKSLQKAEVKNIQN